MHTHPESESGPHQGQQVPYPVYTAAPRMHSQPEFEIISHQGQQVSSPAYTATANMHIPSTNPGPLPPLPPIEKAIPKFNLDVSIPNIIVFGETGVGKSSIINMLQGAEGEVAVTSNSAYGCTIDSVHHEVTLKSPFQGEQKYRLWDTSGLNEGDKGTVPAEQAMANLVSLVRTLGANNSGAGGVSLLVYCIRGARLREIVRVNYDLFWGVICNGKVPIVLVINGLENEENMDQWWHDNRQDLEVMGLKFHGHVCVTSTKGKLTKTGKYMFEEEYAESGAKLRGLVESICALHPEPYKIEGEKWIADIEGRLNQYMSEYNQRTGRERRVQKDYNTVDTGSHVSRSRDPHGVLSMLWTLLQFFMSGNGSHNYDREWTESVSEAPGVEVNAKQRGVAPRVKARRQNTFDSRRDIDQSVANVPVIESSGYTLQQRNTSTVTNTTPNYRQGHGGSSAFYPASDGTGLTPHAHMRQQTSASSSSRHGQPTPTHSVNHQTRY